MVTFYSNYFIPLHFLFVRLILLLKSYIFASLLFPSFYSSSLPDVSRRVANLAFHSLIALCLYPSCHSTYPFSSFIHQSSHSGCPSDLFNNIGACFRFTFLTPSFMSLNTFACLFQISIPLIHWSFSLIQFVPFIFLI